MTSARPIGTLSSLPGNAATGALTMALFALAEILTPGPAPLSEPWRDLSLLSLFGTALGTILGLLRLPSPLRRLSVAGITLGMAVGLKLWFGEVAGDAFVTGATTAALTGALFVGGGLVTGQFIGWIASRLSKNAWGPHPLVSGFVVLALASPLLLSGRGAWDEPDQSNVLLLTIDTLRSDRLGFAGHPAPTSPHLDRLARRGRTRVNAVTPLPRTLPAVASLMTGRVPHGHGVRDNFHYGLGDAAETLAERLADAGWATAAVNSNPVLSHDSGVYQGFASASDRGDDHSRLSLVRGVHRILTALKMRRGDRSQVITDLALAWLDRRPRGRPFFLWVHWLAPHIPYEPAAPFDQRFDPAYKGRWERRLDYADISKGEMTYRNPLTPREMQHAKALYDGEIATADRALGRLLREMEAHGELEDTVVLFTSDHGESLDEHGYFLNHGDFVYGPAAGIPMIVVGANGGAGTLSRDPASLVDVMPMLLDAVDVEVPDHVDGRVDAGANRTVHGESGFCRFPHLNDRLGWGLPREIAQSPDRVPDWTSRWEEQANRAKQRFVQTGNWKLVLSPHPDGDRVELFDLASDPAERTDRQETNPERRDALLAYLRGWIEAGDAVKSTGEARELTDQLRGQLDALGYLGD